MRISIITPSFNQGKYLEETILSVLNQNYPDLEYIIIDGGSTDNSVEIIKKYERHLAYWVSEKDKGQAHAINKGFSRATGDVFAWLNSDDIYMPGALNKVAGFWAETPGCHFLTGDGVIMDSRTGSEEHYIKGAAHSLRDLLHYHEGKYLPQPSVFFSKEAFYKAGPLNEMLFIALDLDLWLRIAEKYRLYYAPVCFSRLLHHDDAKSWKHIDDAAKEVLESVCARLMNTGFLDRFVIRSGLEFFYARKICNEGLERYLKNDIPEASRSFKRAVSTNPLVLFSSAGLKLSARLGLPRSVKKFIFEKP